MAVEANNIPTIEDDLDTTVPNLKTEVWKMPEPVFRKTSGRLPGGFEKLAAPSEPVHVSSPPHENVDTTPSIPPSHTEPAPKSPTLKLVVVVLAIAAMVAFIVVFLTVVYFFFLRG